MVTQIMGFGLATPTQWRLVLLISSAISATQYLLAPAIAESPAYLFRKGLTVERKVVIRSLWGHQFGDARPDRKSHMYPSVHAHFLAQLRISARSRSLHQATRLMSLSRIKPQQQWLRFLNFSLLPSSEDLSSRSHLRRYPNNYPVWIRSAL